MNSQSTAMPEAPRDSQISESRISESRGIAPAAVTAMRPFYWSVRRELWENRSIYIAPLAVAGLVLLGYLIASMGYALSTTNMAQRRAAVEEPYTFAMGVILGTAFIVSIFYSLDALHGERRDRSILFWKSMPVSDLTTVLSKASIPLLVLPLLSFAIVVATELIMLGLSSLVLLASGLPVATLWTMVFQMWLMLLYHLVTVHVLWYAPIYGWLLLVSGWARRAAFLWAVLPWLAIGAVEKIAFNTWHFAAMLGYRFEGGPEAITAADSFPIDPMMHLTPGRFLSSPGLWIGLVVAAAFLAAAVRLRRCQGPI
jgi:ABC-2 type transport system permease protein